MIQGVAGVTFWTEDIERLAGFYRDVLELPVHSVRPEFVAFDLGGSGSTSACIPVWRDRPRTLYA